MLTARVVHRALGAAPSVRAELYFRELLPRFTWEVVPTETGDCGVKLADRVYSLEQMSAMVLRPSRPVFLSSPKRLWQSLQPKPVPFERLAISTRASSP